MLYSRRIILPACFAAGYIASVSALAALPANTPLGIVTALQKKYPVTEVTPNRQQVVTQGVVMTLRCSGIYSDPGSGFALDNIYVGPGKVQASTSAKLFYTKSTHVLQAGEQVYITKIESKSEAKDDMLRFTLVTVNQIDEPDGSQERYAASLTAKFKKGYLDEASPDEIAQGLETIMAPADSSDASQAQNPAPVHEQAVAPAPQQPAPAPPPVAPAAAAAPPATITIGESSTQVLQAMGMPLQMVDLGKKKTFVYKSMKIIFVDDKVSDVQ